MKLGRNIGSVTIPKAPNSVGGVISWAKRVNRTLQELRDRKVAFDNSKRPGFIHPWKATSNGDNTVRVGEGRIHSFLDGDTGFASLSMAGFGDFEGGDVVVTGNGVIYGTVPAALSFQPIINISEEITDSNGDTHTQALALMRVFPDTSTPITVEFAETMPIDEFNTDFYWEIAQVTFEAGEGEESGVATVAKQVLRHDPMLWSFFPPA